MFFYAQLNENNICVDISQLSTEVSGDRMVAIESMDVSLLGQQYTDGTWAQIPLPESPVEAYMPTNAEVAQMISDLQADLIIAGVI